MNKKTIILVILVAAAIGLGGLIWNRSEEKGVKREVVKQEEMEGWQEVEENKWQKEEGEYRKTVVLSEGMEEDKLDRYIKGAKVAIPSLKITENEEGRIEGWYLNQGKKIMLIMIYDEEKTVTGTYWEDEGGREEVERMMERI